METKNLVLGLILGLVVGGVLMTVLFYGGILNVGTFLGQTNELGQSYQPVTIQAREFVVAEDLKDQITVNANGQKYSFANFLEVQDSIRKTSEEGEDTHEQPNDCCFPHFGISTNSDDGSTTYHTLCDDCGCSLDGDKLCYTTVTYGPPAKPGGPPWLDIGCKCQSS
ncbi:hypothetical protein ACFL0Z_02590 [Patescibacteria group bacterium]